MAQGNHRMAADQQKGHTASVRVAHQMMEKSVSHDVASLQGARVCRQRGRLVGSAEPETLLPASIAIGSAGAESMAQP